MPAPASATPSAVRMVTPPVGRLVTLTFIRLESWLTSWPWMFCEPVGSPPLSWAWAMSVFSESICASRPFTCVTSPVILESTLLDSWVIWSLMLLASLRKFWTSFTAWPRSRLDDGSLAAEPKAAEIWSGMLKK